MNTTLQQINDKLANYRLLYLLAVGMLLIVMPDLSFAAGGASGSGATTVPSLTTGTIGITTGGSILKTLLLTIAAIVFITVIAAVGFGMTDTIISFFRQLNDSRKEGEWGPLLRFIGLAFAVLAIVFVIMGYINTYIISVANTSSF